MRLIISFVLLLSACNLSEKKNKIIGHVDTTIISNRENQLIKKDSINKTIAVDSVISKMATQHLAITSNALQIVNGNTGSTSEITFGKSLDELVELTNKILQIKASSIGINSECGAGPLKMAVWKNGLSLIFKEHKSNGLWQFAGWYVGKPVNNTKSLQTMAGIGIGSTRDEMEAAYVIKVTKTSLGYEFFTTSGLYGIFDGPNKNAKITDIWSGLTCIFR